MKTEFTDADLEILISAEEIVSRVDQLGKQITKDYTGRQPLVVGLLNEASFFVTDLVRRIDLSLSIEYMHISLSSQNEVRIIKDLDVSIEGREVIFVAGLVASGSTVWYLTANLWQRGARSLTLVSLLNKPDQRVREVSIDYLGFTIPDVFVVGYGLDFSGRYSNLPFLAYLKEREVLPGLLIPSI